VTKTPKKAPKPSKSKKTPKSPKSEVTPKKTPKPAAFDPKSSAEEKGCSPRCIISVFAYELYIL
jgi:hypothetical protein